MDDPENGGKPGGDDAFAETVRQAGEVRRDAERAALGHLLAPEDARERLTAEYFSGAESPACRALRLVAAYFGVGPGAVGGQDSQPLAGHGVDNASASHDGEDGTLDEERVLQRMAEKAGLRLRRVKLEKDWRLRDHGPLIGLYKNLNGADRQPVAVLPGPRPDRYRIHTDAHPEGIPVDRAVLRLLHPEAYCCYAALPDVSLSPIRAVVLHVRRLWPTEKWTILLTSLAAALLPLLLPVIVKSAFSDIIPLNDRQALGTATQVLLVASFAMTALSLARGIACFRIKTRFGRDFEAALWSRLISLSPEFFRRYRVGDLINRMQSAGAVSGALDSSFLSALFSLASGFSSLLLMIHYSIRLTFWALVVWIVYAAVIGFFYWRAVGTQRRAIAASNELSSWVLQLLDGISVFRLRAAEERAFSLWAKRFGEEWKQKLELRRIANRIGLVNAAQPIVLAMILYYVATQIFHAGKNWGFGMSLPDFLAFQTLYTGFNGAVMQFIPFLAGVTALRPHLDNLAPILEARPEGGSGLADAGPLSGRIEMRNVTFAYDRDQPPAVKDVSLILEPGKSLALVGGSGSGKSTLVRLLLGFETPQSGGVYYDGQDLAALNPASVRGQIGVVLQHGRLTAGDIFTNIVGGRPLTRDEAWSAAERVGLAADIRAMPLGMDTPVGEGGGALSGGQRQRILIARSIVHRPRILIMDEATSSLDNRTQAAVTCCLEDTGATRLIVAHRLSTVRRADRIVVMEKGRIVEAGDFDELLAQGGLFTALAGKQLE